MIGFAVGTPLQSIRLFFPYSCAKSMFDLAFEGFDFYIFYDQMQKFKSDQDTRKKNMIFSVISLLSIIFEIP
jgi:hypothetical protein